MDMLLCDTCLAWRDGCVSYWRHNSKLVSHDMSWHVSSGKYVLDVFTVEYMFILKTGLQKSHQSNIFILF